MDCKWYIIQVSSGQEEKVSNVIIENSKNVGLGDYFKKVFIPYEEVIRIKRNKKVSLKRKLMPGYIFLLMHLNDDTLNFVKSITNVSNFLSDNTGTPKVISDEEIEKMCKKVDQGVVDDASSLSFEPGDEVIINDGLFQDFTGKVEYVNEDKKIACVSVMIFGRLTRIDFKLDHIEKKLEG